MAKILFSWLLFLALLCQSSLAVVRVMPLGDSITAGGCWRAQLYQKLTAGGLSSNDFRFVGTQKSLFSCQGKYDTENEGHVGYEAIGIAKQNLLPPWLEKSKPVDIVMMLLGTNDVWRGRKVTDSMNAFSTLLEQMRASNPKVKLLVAKIPPLKPSGVNCGSNCNTLSAEYNKGVEAFATSKTTEVSPVIVVDCFNGFDIKADLQDGVHPNTGSGTKKMADCWYEPLAAVIKASK